jgi:hypothetical protein
VKRPVRRRAFSRLAAMPGRALTAPLAFALAVVIAGCGSSNDGTIPENDASRLLGALALAQGDLEAGTCDVLISHVNEFSSAVDRLPNSVDESVRDELQKASQNLEQLAQEPDQCSAGTSGAQGAEPADTSTTSTTTTPTTTTTEETTTTDEDTDDEEKPDHGNGGGGGEEDQTTTEESPPPEQTEPPTSTSTTPPTGEQGGGQGEASNGQNEGTDSGGVTGGKQ